MKDYVMKYWLGRFKEVLKDREMCLKDFIEKLGEPDATVRRYVDLFIAMGILKARYESSSHRKYISLVKKKRR